MRDLWSNFVPVFTLPDFWDKVTPQKESDSREAVLWENSLRGVLGLGHKCDVLHQWVFSCLSLSLPLKTYLLLTLGSGCVNTLVFVHRAHSCHPHKSPKPKRNHLWSSPLWLLVKLANAEMGSPSPFPSAFAEGLRWSFKEGDKLPSLLLRLQPVSSS